MRTRSKIVPTTTVALGPLAWQVRNSSGVITESTTNASIGRSLVTIEGSEVITDDNSPGRGIKTVAHTKTLITRPVTSSSAWQGATPGASYITRQGPGCMWYDWAWGVTNPVTLNFPGTHSYDNVMFSNSEAKLIADTVHAFYAINETDNLLNVVEAPQLLGSLVSLRRTLTSPATVSALTKALKTRVNALQANLGLPRGILNRIDYLRQSIKSTTSSAKRKSLSAELKLVKQMVGKHGTKVSGAFLAYQFGIAPLVSDMMKVHKELDSLQSKLKTAQKSAGKLVSIHRRDQGNMYFRNSSTGASVSSPFQGSTYINWSYTSQNVSRTCTVRGYRTQKFSTPAFQQLDYLMSRFGATGPATLVKELIPFSFVLEWFVDLRNITDRLDNLLTGNSKRILDCCVSEKSQYRVSGRFTSSSSYINVTGIGMELCSIDVSQYNRKPVTSYNIIRESGRFGKKQVALSAALLHQHVANLFR